MPTPTIGRRKPKVGLTVVASTTWLPTRQETDQPAGARTKYFHVKALSNSGYRLEPRVQVPPHAITPGH